MHCTTRASAIPSRDGWRTAEQGRHRQVQPRNQEPQDESNQLRVGGNDAHHCVCEGEGDFEIEVREGRD
jgi:hypothetical protein